MAKKINITAQLNAATTDGILADAGQIFDAKKGKFQEQVNEEFEDALEEAITSEETDKVVESIEEGIVHNALRKTEQILTEAEKGQARENIGAVSEQTFENEAVRVKKQVFTSEQKYQARHNISAITAEEAEKIAQDKINETSVSSPDKLQAVKELSSWLEDNPDSAATMNAAIQENSADIQRLYHGTGIDEYSQFSTGMDYAIGDVVLYDGVLFRFKADHAKGAWDYNEVEEWSEKKEREEKLTELGSEVGVVQSGTYESGTKLFEGEFLAGKTIYIAFQQVTEGSGGIVFYGKNNEKLSVMVSSGERTLSAGFSYARVEYGSIVLTEDIKLPHNNEILYKATLNLQKIERSKVVELKVISSIQAEYQNISEGEYSYNPRTNSLNYTTNGLHYQTSILKDTIFKYANKLLLINAEGKIMLVDTLIPILAWSNDAATLLSAGKGEIVYNKYSKAISIVTGSQLWDVNFNPKSLFFYDGELFSWDAENSILIKIKNIDNLSKWVAEVDSKAKVGVLAQNTLDKIVMKSVGDEIVNDELFDILINATTGQETDHSGAYASGYIPIIGNEEYYISGSMAWGHAVYAWYDEDKKFISGYAAEGGSTITRIVNDLVVAPTNAAYIRVCRWKTNQEGKVNEVKLSAVTEGNSGWKGKKWVCVGDSLTEHNSRATKNYHDYVAEVTGIEVVNMGVSGTGYKRQEENGRAFYQRVENIPSDANVITIFGSGNDGAYWGSNLGTALDATTDTIGGCINITIDNILAKMPLAVVGIVSPTPWNNNKPGDDTMMKKYANLLKQICENRGIPFLDLFHNSGLRPWDESFKQLAYSRDEGNGVHPDENGHKLIAPRFKAFLETLIM